MSEVTQTVHDPVCHMDINIQDAAGKSDYMDKKYYFCSGGCKRDFDANPEAVLKAEAEHDHTKPVEMMTMAAAGPEPGSGRKPWWQFWRS
jgi:YHS domain-containing protein